MHREPARDETHIGPWSALKAAVRSEVLRLVGETGLPEGLIASVHRRLTGEGAEFSASHPDDGMLLPLLAYESAGGGAPADAAAAGASIWLFFRAAGGLDDIQDGELDVDSSPGQMAETVTILLVLSQAALLRMTLISRIPPERVLKALAVLHRMQTRSVSGQHMEIAISHRPTVALETALEASAAKTGSLLRAAAEIGATLATDDAELIEMHGALGEHLGMQVQLINDMEGIWPGAVGTDLALGRRTPPIAFALSVPRGINRAADRVREALVSGSPDVIDEQSVRDSLLESGALHFACIQAARHRLRARRLAEQIKARRPDSRIDSLM